MWWWAKEGKLTNDSGEDGSRGEWVVMNKVSPMLAPYDLEEATAEHPGGGIKGREVQYP